ncbi:Calx-beta domain-containing protein [Candidatus Poriferisodalis sp.]|uniref:Calx-beta domain-containing protein n=1 Tax=Candidatus Poriferisodalis sp. TaxID=3101277 RepID=UPI003B0189B7
MDNDTPAIVLGDVPLTIAEGARGTFTVELLTQPSDTVMVRIDGSVGTDLTLDLTVLEFSRTNWNTAQTVTVSVAQDVGSDDETVSLDLTAAGGDYDTVTASLVVTIVDDDFPDVEVSFGSGSYSVSEGSTVTVTVTLSAEPEREVTVALSATGLGGADATDFSGVPSDVTFAADETSQQFVFTAIGDSVDDDNESVRLSFGTLPAGVTAAAPTTATVAIVDDDVPAVEVSFGSGSYSVSEGSTVTVTVTLSAVPEREVVVALSAAGLGGADAADFSGVPSDVTFAADETSQQFVFTAIGDSVDDDNESVRLSFGTLPAGVTAAAPTTATVAIVDDDVPAVEVSFGSGSYSVSEGSTVTVTVSLSAVPEREVVVALSAAGLGGADAADFSGVPSDVTFAADETSQQFVFTAIGDSVDDDNESVRLSFGTLPAGVTAAAPTTATVAIVDDDVPAVEVSFGSGSYSVSEGSTVTVTVSLSAVPEREVVVALSAAGLGGADAADFSGVPSDVTFAADETSQQFVFTAIGDSVDDDNESVRLSFGTLPAGVTAAAPTTATVAIDDDDVPAVEVSFGSGSYSVSEGSTVTVTVSLSAVPEREVVVSLSAAGLGGADAADFSGVPSDVTFAADETSQQFVFTAIGDSVDDDNESVRLSFGTLPAGVTAAAPTTATVAIDDDDVPAVEVSFGSGSYSVSEGSTVTVTVSLSAVPEREVVVSLSAAGLGGADAADFSGVPSDVTFAADETSQQFVFTAIGDSVDDDNESVRLSFGTLPAGVTAASPVSATITIDDDDVPQVEVSFGSGSYSVSEGSTVTVTVTLSAEPEREVVVALSAAGLGGADTTDFSGVPSDVTFAADETSQQFVFTATGDSVDDDNESVRLSFGTLPAGVTAAAPTTATIAIDDDDVPQVEVSFGSGSYSVSEGSTVTVTVTLSAEPEREVVVALSAAGLGGADAADFSGVPSDVTFAADETSQQFVFTAIGDSVDDDNESVRLSFGTLPAGVTAAAPTTATVAIDDDDVPAVEVSFGSGSYSVSEGSTVTVTVSLSAVPEREVVVSLSAAGLGGADAADFSGVPSDVTFAADETSQQFVFTATGDSVDDDNESVRLSFGTLPAGVTAAAPTTATVAIDDDDVPAVEVSFGSGSYSVSEGSTVTVTVSLSAVPEREVVVSLSAAGLGGADAADFSGVPSDVTFAADETSQQFVFTAIGDSVDDDNESVRLSFGTLPAGVTAAAPVSATVAIDDDDVPAVEVSFGSGSYSVSEGSTVTVTVSLSAVPEREVVVALSAAGLGGADATDFSGVPSDVTFAADETSQQFVFTAIGDSVDDDNESVRLSFGTLPAGVTAAAPTTATIAIDDDDVPQVEVSFGSGSYSVSEGSTVTVTVTLSAEPEREVVVALSAAGLGGADAADFSGVPSDVTFAADETSQQFVFTAIGDSVDDDNESVRLSFGTLPAGVTAASPVSATITIDDDDVPQVEVSFGSGSYSVSEGSTVTVTVTLSAEPEREVTVPLSAAGLGGADTTDFSGVPSDVTFAADETSQQFVFTATGDSVDDDNESVRLSFGTLPAGVTAAAPTTATIAIDDDDVPQVEVSFGSGSYSVSEGSTVTVTVTLSAEPEREVTVPLSAAGLGGADATDFSGVPSDVTFAADETSQQFVFTATGDSVDDDNESVRLSFGTLPAGVTAAAPTTATIAIDDDDVPQVEVSFGSGSYSVSEGSTVTVTVTLSAEPEREVTVPLSATGLGGADTTDFSGVPSDVTFAADETSQQFVFTATGDSVDDDNESVRLSFGTLPAGVTAAAPTTATIAIDDDDVPQVEVSFGSGSYSVSEGSTVTVTVTLSAEPEREVTVPLSATGLGGADTTDFSGVPSDVTFAADETSQQFVFTATGDSVDDDNESVRLSFGTLPAGVTAAAPTTATVTIDDDDVPQVEVSFGSGSYSVSEGSTVTVTVTLSAEPEREVTVPLSATGLGGADTTDFSGVPSDVTFAADETSQQFVFTATGDSVDDDNESVRLSFGTLPAGVTAAAPTTATITIDDDDVPQVEVSFGSGSYSVSEGSTVTVTVTLSAEPEREVTVPLSATGLGGADTTDFSGVPSDVTFAADETSQQFVFTATGDSVDDDNESVRLSFGTLPAGVTAAAPTTATITIDDDDVPQVEVSFGSGSYSVSEGSTVTVTVTLSAEPEREVTVPLSAAGLGGADAADFSGVPSDVTFAADETSQQFVFTATGDSVDDDNESVRLSFGTLPAGVTAAAPVSATVAIVDDDVPAVEVSFGSGSYSVSEGSTVTVTVSLSAVPEREVTVPLSAAGLGGADAADFSGVPSDVTFAADETSQQFVFTAIGDSVDDDNESVRLSFGTLPAGVTAAAPTTATVAIDDDDVPAVEVSFGSGSYSVSEGSTVTVTVSLSAVPEREVTVPLSATGLGGADAADFSGVPSDVTFAADETSQQFVFTATGDSVDDDNESVRLSFGVLPAGVTAAAPVSATVAIVDDDVPAVEVSFGSGSYSVSEGSTVTVTVSLSAVPEREVTVALSAAGLGGADAADFSGVPSDVTFAADETSQQFVFTAIGDSVDDDNESVRLSFGVLPAGVTAAAPVSATVAIVDDDVPAVEVSFGSGSYSVSEGSTVTVTVTLSAVPEREVTVPLSATGLGGADATDFSGVPSDVTFAADETSQQFVFTAIGDSVDDDNESVRLSFGVLPAGVTAAAPVSATVAIVDDDVPAVEVSFGSGSYSVSEGSTVTVTVSLSAVPEREVTVALSAAGLGGADAADFSGVPSDVTFAADETSQQFVFTATGDSVDDDNESVRLSFGVLPAGVTAAAPVSATVAIVDDDVPAVEVSFGSGSYSVSEGSTVTVTVSLSAVPEREVTVALSAAGLGGADAADFSGVPSDVTFAADETSQQFVFTAIGDSVDDDNESVRLSFGTLPAGVTAAAPTTATIAIDDDDVPQVEVSFGSGSYSVSEGSTVTVTVTLSAVPEREVTVPLSATGLGGADATDFSGVPSDVTFAADETSQQFVFTAIGDSVDDDNESVRLSFGTLPAGVTAAAPTTATIAIDDDDVPQVEVSFGSGSYSVSEGSTVTVTVTLSAVPEREVTVPLSAAGLGGADAADFSGVPSDVTFAADETSQQFVFTAIGDSVDDDNESVRLSFGTLPAGVTAAAPTTATIAIDDDDVPQVEVSFGSGSYSVSEGSTVTVTVTLSAVPEREVTVALSATGLGGADATDFSGVPSDVTFAADETSQQFVFTAIGDSVDDDNESVRLSFGTLPAGVTAAAPTTATIAIDDDDVPQVEVSFGSGSYSVLEGSTVTVTVTLSAVPEREVTVPLSAAGLGGADAADFSGVPSDVTFAADETSQQFVFTAIGDSVDDDNESVRLSFGTLPAGVTAAAPTTATVAIDDDDVPAVEVSFGSGSYSVSEGSTVTVTVTLSAVPEREVTVPLSATGLGGADTTDFSGVPSDVTFAADETSQQFVFTAIGDSVDDDNESVRLSFGTLPAGVTAAAPTTATVAIDDDDVPQVEVSFGSGSYSVSEGSTVTVTVTLSAVPEREVTVPLSATGLGGADTTDFSGVPSDVTFAADETSQQFVFTAIGDSVDDDNESVRLSFGTLPAGVTAAAPTTATVAIDDDDVPQVEDDPVRDDILRRLDELPPPGQCAPASAAEVGDVLRGSINAEGESVWFAVRVEPYVLVTLWLRSVAGQHGALPKPRIIQNRRVPEGVNQFVYAFKRRPFSDGSIWYPASSGIPATLCFQVVSLTGGVGSFEVEVELNEDPRLAGAPGGYVSDAGANPGTARPVPTGYELPNGSYSQLSFRGLLGDHNMSGADEDWFRVELEAGFKYRFSVEPEDQYGERYRPDGLAVTGVFNAEGDLIEGTSSVEANGMATVEFVPSGDGVHYVGISATGIQTHGLYVLTISRIRMPVS